jgi:hypothetical protein
MKGMPKPYASIGDHIWFYLEGSSNLIYSDSGLLGWTKIMAYSHYGYNMSFYWQTRA